MKKIRALIVDDEPLARERMRSLLGAEPDMDIVGEARDGIEAVEAILAQSPDLVFLDVHMPKLDGFEVIQTVGSDRMPPVVFVTAYDQHALRAFEVQALDYLLKPFDADRFQSALKRVRRQIDSQETGDLGRRLLALVRDLEIRTSAAAATGWSSNRAAVSSSCAPTKSTGSRRPATTSACTSAPKATSCARR